MAVVLRIFPPAGSHPDSRPENKEIELVFPENQPDEPIEDGKIELGEQAVQALIVALDPYPRHADAHLGEVEWPKNQRLDPDINPFAKLAVLKKGPEDKG